MHLQHGRVKEERLYTDGSHQLCVELSAIVQAPSLLPLSFLGFFGFGLVWLWFLTWSLTRMTSNLVEAQAGLELSIFLPYTLERLGFIGSYYYTTIPYSGAIL